MASRLYGIDEMETKNHSLTLLIAQSALLLLSFLIGMSIIHEGAHRCYRTVMAGWLGLSLIGRVLGKDCAIQCPVGMFLAPVCISR